MAPDVTEVIYTIKGDRIIGGEQEILLDQLGCYLHLDPKDQVDFNILPKTTNGNGKRLIKKNMVEIQILQMHLDTEDPKRKSQGVSGSQFTGLVRDSEGGHHHIIPIYKISRRALALLFL